MPTVEYGKDQYYKSNDLGQAGIGGFRQVASNPIFRMIFDPLGITDSALSKFAPDTVKENPVNRDDFQSSPEMRAYMEKLRQFYEKLSGPIDMNDPGVKAMVGNALAAADRKANAQGIRGGLSVSNSQQATANALAQYDNDRQKLYMQGLSQLAGLQGQQDMYNDQRYRNALLDERGLAQQYRNELQNKNAGIMGLAGSVIGGIFGQPQLGNAAGQASGGQGVTPTYGSGSNGLGGGY